MVRARSLRPVSVIAIALACLVWAGPILAQGGFNPGPQYQGFGFGQNKIQYRDFDWEIYHSPHFDVYYYQAEEDQLERVVSFAESAYDRLSRRLDFQIEEPTPLIFYATHGAFEQNNIILNFIPEGTGAFASPVRFRMVLPVDLPDPELMNLILHELTHIFQYHILFQGSIAKAVTATPPLWLMEGMASFMAKDESARDRMYLRDAVVNDRIPEVTRWSGNGFFAYRIGHAVLDFIEERWGYQSYLDFIYEVRNTIGSGVAKAVERTFRMEPQEFDQEFRLWLRKKYLPQLIDTGEPGEFGRAFGGRDERPAQTVSATASPSGDLVAAFTSRRGDVDIGLFDTENRRFVRNLTAGFSNEYRYLVAQELTLGRKMGRDIAFSPDGNSIAVFAKREAGRSLFLVDVLQGGLKRRIDMPQLDQQTAPAWSPDGRTVAFAAWQDGFFDIFVVDIDSEEITNLTDDELFDGAPVFTPDGESLVFSSVVGEGGHAKLFQIDLDNPSQRTQLTFGPSRETDAIFSTDNDQRVYFTSDRSDGVENIFSLDLDDGTIRQYTDAVTGCFMPTVLADPEGEKLVFSSLWKGRFGLYVTDTGEPVEGPIDSELTPEEQEAEALAAEEIPTFEPDIEVAINDDNKENYGGFNLFLETADSFIGVDDDQTFIGQIVLSFSDYLGDRRLVGTFSSVDSFSNFDVSYLNLSDRLQWSVRLFDDRSFFLSRVPEDPTDVVRDRLVFRQTGAIASLIYPLSFYTRAELGAGYVFRKLDQQVFGEFLGIDDDYPLLQGALVGDSTVAAPWGPVSGRRWRLDATYAPDLESSGAVTRSVDIDVRQYVPLTRRSNLAFRGFAGYSDGNEPNPFFFGGLDTVRGVRFRGLAGDRAFFANMEMRFPLIDVLATPAIAFQGIRGVLFVDVGGAWFEDFEEFDFYNTEEDRLEDAIVSYGFGVTLRLFGLPVNWDFSKLYRPSPRFGEEDEGFQTTFWIGTRF